MFICHITHRLEDKKSLTGEILYRVIQPLRALTEKNHIYAISGDIYSPEIYVWAEKADILIISCVSFKDLLPIIMKRRLEGKKTFYEIADYFSSIDDISSENKHIQCFINPTDDHKMNLINLAQYSDGVFFSGRGLQRYFGHIHSHTRIIPNRFWTIPCLSIKDSKVIALGGSPSHIGDILDLLPYLKKFLNRNKEYVFYLLGLYHIRHDIVSKIKGYENNFQVIPWMNYENYMLLLKEKVGFALISLQDHAFNDCRSDIKFWEYTAMSIPVAQIKNRVYIAAMCEKKSFVIDKAEDTASVLEYMIKHPKECEQRVKCSYEYIQRHLNEQENTCDREQFMKIKKHTLLTNRNESEDIMNNINKDSAYEKLIFNKYTHIYAEKDIPIYGVDYAIIQEQTQCFKRKYPNFYLSYIFEGNIQFRKDKAYKCFARACELNPKSVYAFSEWSKRCFQFQDTQKGLFYLEKACYLSPCDVSLRIRLMDKHVALGNWEKAYTNLKVVLNSTMYYAGLSEKVIKIMHKYENFTDSIDLTEKIIHLHPNQSKWRWLLGKGLKEDKQFNLSKKHLIKGYEMNPHNIHIKSLLYQLLIEKSEFKLLKSISSSPALHQFN